MTLQRVLDSEHAEIRDRVRAWLSLPGNAPPYDMRRDKYREWVLDCVKALAKEGDTARGFPPEYGGANDVDGFVASFETLAMGDLSVLVKTGVHFGLFGGAVLHLGTKRHHDAYLRDVISVDLPGCFAMTEMGHGSNVQAVQTTATYDAEAQEFEIHTPDPSARKEYIGNSAQHGRMAAVFAQLVVAGESQGVHALLVPLRDKRGRILPGVTIVDDGPKLGLDGVDNGRITFDHVRVPREALLDRYGTVSEDGVYSSPIENPAKRFFTMLGTLVMGRVSVCGAAVNAAKVAQTIAVRWGNERRQFGAPDAEEARLLDYRTHQRRLLPGLAATYALHFAQDRLRGELHNVFTAAPEDAAELDRRKLETFAAGLKAVATWHASETIQACREACGGMGYLRENRFASLKADTDVFTTFEGDNTVLLQLCAKNLLTDYKDQFGELDPLGIAAFFAGQVFEAVVERTAARELVGRIADELLPGREADEELLDREVQLGLFRFRQEHLQENAARRLKGGMDAGYDPFEVLVECQDHVVESGRAWVDLVVLESFATAVDGLEDGEDKALLDKLCSLYALSRVEATRAFYQEHGRISSPRSKAVIKAVNALCGELRPHAAELVEAFGVPENVLGEAVVRPLTKA